MRVLAVAQATFVSGLLVLLPVGRRSPASGSSTGRSAACRARTADRRRDRRPWGTGFPGSASFSSSCDPAHRRHHAAVGRARYYFQQAFFAVPAFGGYSGRSSNSSTPSSENRTDAFKQVVLFGFPAGDVCCDVVTEVWQAGRPSARVRHRLPSDSRARSAVVCSCAAAREPSTCRSRRDLCLCRRSAASEAGRRRERQYKPSGDRPRATRDDVARRGD
jgi:hypothetical protein